MSQQPPPAPTASAISPCPTIIQTSRTPRHCKFTQHLCSTRPSPLSIRSQWFEPCVLCFLFFHFDFIISFRSYMYLILFIYSFSLSGLTISPLQANCMGDSIFQCRVVLLVWIMVGQGHTVLAVGVGEGSLDIFFCRLSFFFSSSLSQVLMDDLILRPFQ